MKETDKEFVERAALDVQVHGEIYGFDRPRLVTLARSGAEAADEIARLRAALAHADAKGQENDKLLWGTIKDNERLRAALKTARPFIGWAGHYPTILAEIDAALKEDGDA